MTKANGYKRFSSIFYDMYFRFKYTLYIHVVYHGCKRKIHYICRIGKLSFLPGIFIFRLTRRVSLVERGLLTLPEHLSSPGFQWGSFYSIFSFICMFCRSLFVLLHFLPLAIVLYFVSNIRILINILSGILISTKCIWQ